jgi:hypothetical protein
MLPRTLPFVFVLSLAATAHGCAPARAAAQRALAARGLEDDDLAVRAAAARLAWASQLGPERTRALRTLLEGSAERKAEAAAQLADHGDTLTVPALFAAAADPEGVVADVARAALCRLGSPGACGQLEAVFGVRDPARVGPAAMALVRSTDPAATRGVQSNPGAATPLSCERLELGDLTRRSASFRSGRQPRPRPASQRPASLRRQ